MIDDTFYSLLDVLPVTEGTETDIALPGRTEPASRGDDDMALGEKYIEQVPAAHAVWSLDPHIRCIVSAVDFKTLLSAFHHV